MSTLKADAVTTKSDNTDLTITGGGTGVPNLEAGFKVGGTVGVPISGLQVGTDGELITWDASGDPAAVAVGTATHVLTSNGAGAAPTFQAAGGGDTGESFLVTMSGNQTLATSTNTKIQLDSETFDIGNNFDPTTNYRLTPTAGKWFLNMATGLTSGTSSTCDLNLFKNGTYYITSQWEQDIAEGVTTINIVLSASGTDYYEMFVNQRHGSNKDIYGDTTYFSGFRIE